MKNKHFILLSAIAWLCGFHQTTFAQTWAKLDGLATDIGAGANGQAWMVSKEAATGGFNLYRRASNTWTKMSGTAVRIAVDPQGNPWVVNSSDDIFQYNGSTWVKIDGKAKDIGIGANGTVWAIGNVAEPGGYGVFKRTGTSWTKLPGAAVRIAVDPQGNAWTVNDAGKISQYTGNTSVFRPGSAKDIAIGASGSVWVTGSDDKLWKWSTASNNWEAKTGSGVSIAIGKDEEVWVVKAQGEINYSAASAVTTASNLSFPRQQTWEGSICNALKMPDVMGSPAYNSLSPLNQAIGSLALDAAEVYFATKNENPTPSAAIQSISSNATVRNSVLGLLATAVQDKLKKGGTDAQHIALKNWSTAIYRRMRIDMAQNTLAEYKKWNADPCSYVAEGYTKPSYCGVQRVNYFPPTPKVPTEIIGKQGLKASMGDADAIVAGVSTGLSAVSLAAASVALSAGLGNVVWASSMAPSVTAVTSLYSAFGGSVVTNAATGATTAGIGASGWGGVVAGPAAIVTFAAVFISLEAINVYEYNMAEPRLKKELGKAMTETIQIANVVSTEQGASTFFIAFIKAANNSWATPLFNDKGEVTFFCQAGFVSKFNLSYKLNGQTVSKDTKNLPVGEVESIEIPAGATNIVAKGYMISAGDHLLFTQNIAAPTYTCYKTYGTIFSPQWGPDWPLKDAAQLKLFHQGGYVAKFQIDYERNGETTTIETGDQTAGWTNTYTIPEDAKNIRLRAWGATGLAWEPWRQTLDHTFPDPPNECVKIYGTTLDQQWASDCE